MSPASEKFLASIRSDDAEVRFAAWSQGNDADPEVIPALGKLLVAEQPGVRKAADEALKRMVHGVGKQPQSARRTAVVQQLIVLTGDGQTGWTRTVALRHLSLVGGDETVPVAAKLLRNVELQEEAIFCLERIPGPASTRAIMQAFPDVSESFRPRILAALGHRKAEEATDLCAGAINSPNVETMMAGLKAGGRIGNKPTVSVRSVDYDSLTGWQKIEYTDSTLRYADDQVRRGNTAEAIKYYGRFLDRPEEHLQCAAIIGLSKTGSPEAAGLIFTKLKSPDHTVRITARKAWDSMAKA
jgi:HEAT repeat protein